MLGENGSYVERLWCHGRLPLIAGRESARPAVHVWRFGSSGLQELGVIDGPAYPAEVWERRGLIPSVAWHPSEPALVVTGGAGLRRWTPDGVAAVTGLSPHHVAFSPDGRTLWASPSSSPDEDEAWQYSDALDLATGALRTGPRWDTGVTGHPGGGLVATLSSDQGATDVLFARPGDGVPAPMRVFRHAIVLDVDGYESPVFSPDGRYLAIRGNAYVHSLDVFEFPTLRKVLHTALGDPYPGYPYPPEWLEEQATWSRHNIAFTGTGALLVGTPAGTVVEIDLESRRASDRRVADAAVSAMSVTSTGRLVIADRSGQLAVTDGPGEDGPGEDGPGAVRPAGAPAARERVAEFLAATTELPEDADLYSDLVRNDGSRTWNRDDLEAVTTADDSDPTWLRLQAAINAHRQARE